MAQDALQLGMVTWQLAGGWDIPTIISNCKETGWKAVELRTGHKHGVEPSLDKAARAKVKKQFAESGVLLLSLGSTCEYHSADQAEVKRQIQLTKEWIGLAADVGARAVKVRPNGLQREAGIPEEVTLRQIGESLLAAADTAQAAGVEIWLEVHGAETKHPMRIYKIMQVVNHPMVGVCWNCTPPDLVDGSVKEYYNLLKPWVRVFHIHELWDAEYPYHELFQLAISSGFKGYALAEIDESAEPLRLMRYYKALFDQFVNTPFTR